MMLVCHENFQQVFLHEIYYRKKECFSTRDTFFITIINFLLMRYFPNLLTCFSSTTTDNHVDFYLLIALTTIRSLIFLTTLFLNILFVSQRTICY